VFHCFFAKKIYIIFFNRKDIYCPNITSPAKPEGLSAGAHAAVKQGCPTAWLAKYILRFRQSICFHFSVPLLDLIATYDRLKQIICHVY
jgi:hypothetical protein